MTNNADEYEGFAEAYKHLCMMFVDASEDGQDSLNYTRFAHPEHHYDDVKNKQEVALTIYNVQFTLTDPKKWTYKIEDNFDNCRVPSLSCGTKEAYMIFSPLNNVDYMPWYRRFSRDGLTSNSMYGQWIYPMLWNIIEKLANNPTTRQCVFTIYKNELNVWTEDVTDVPCTLMGIFDIVKGKLNLTIYMRSNDLYLGTPYNVMMFTYLQQVVFNELHKIFNYLELGTYTHVAHCLHVYADQIPQIFQIAFSKTKMENVVNDVTDDISQAMERTANYVRSVDGKEN